MRRSFSKGSALARGQAIACRQRSSGPQACEKADGFIAFGGFVVTHSAMELYHRQAWYCKHMLLCERMNRSLPRSQVISYISSLYHIA